MTIPSTYMAGVGHVVSEIGSQCKEVVLAHIQGEDISSRVQQLVESADSYKGTMWEGLARNFMQTALEEVRDA